MNMHAESQLEYELYSFHREPNWCYLNALEVVEEGAGIESTKSCVRAWIRMLQSVRDGVGA